MKVAILGSSGCLAREYINHTNLDRDNFQYFSRHKVIGFDVTKPRLGLDEKNLSLLKECSVIIYMAAVIDIFKCENDYNLAYNVNALGISLLREIISREARIIYISTQNII